MAGEWSIDYSEFSAGSLGIHGVVLVTRPDGTIIRSLQGLATDGKLGCAKPIGAAILGDKLIGYVDAGRSGLAQSQPARLFTGNQREVYGRLSAMITATVKINLKNLPYELPGPFSVIGSIFSSSAGTNVNSNSYVATMVRLIGAQLPRETAYTTLLGRIGTRGQILDDRETADIRAGYGPDFLASPNGASAPETLLPSFTCR